MIRTDFCKGCKWDKDYEGCPNEYKSDTIRYKSGRLKVSYCMWAEPVINIRLDCPECYMKGSLELMDYFKVQKKFDRADWKKHTLEIIEQVIAENKVNE